MTLSPVTVGKIGWEPGREGVHSLTLCVVARKDFPAYALKNYSLKPNAWIARVDDTNLTLSCPTRQRIGRVELRFDTDFDHPLESVIMLHPETVGPFCVQEYEVCHDRQERIFTRWIITKATTPFGLSSQSKPAA